jgi:DNA-binding response OmpR family regulator
LPQRNCLHYYNRVTFSGRRRRKNSGIGWYESLAAPWNFAKEFQIASFVPISLETLTLYQFGRFRFDPANHLLLSEESPIPLTPKAFDVLLVLVQNGRRLTTKEELMQKVWPDSFVEEANLTVNISALRRILGRMEDGQQYIETVPKIRISIRCACFGSP